MKKKDLKKERKKDVPIKEKKRELSIIFSVILIIVLLFIIFTLINQKKISTVGKSVTTQSVQTQNCNPNGDSSECVPSTFCIEGVCQDQSVMICICSEEGYAVRIGCSNALDAAEQDVRVKLENPTLVCNREEVCGNLCSPPKLISSSTTTIDDGCEAKVRMAIGCMG